VPPFAKYVAFCQVCRTLPSVPHFAKCAALCQACSILPSVPHFAKCAAAFCQVCRTLPSVPHFAKCAALCQVCRISERPIKCLGVYLTYDYDEFIKMNYKQRLKKIENTANWWKGRGLTLYGRAQIINSLLFPKLIYIASMFAVP